jgi:putative sigma-54 modulation protein
MDIVVFGKHVEVSPTLRAHSREKLERLTKFASDVRRIDVDYDEHPTRRASDSHTCEILVHLNKHLVKGRASSTDFLAALDIALDKVEHQMRRLHERRVHRRNGTKGARANGANADPADTERDDELEVVKIKQFTVKPMDTEEAGLQMDLLGHDFFLFTNVETGRAAVLYRRRDGKLGLIEATG